MSERVQESMSSEILSLQHQLLSLEKGKRDFEDQLHELQYNKKQLELANSNLTNRLAQLEEEKEGKEKDLVSVCNSLELQMAADLRRMIGSQGEHDQLDPLPNMLQQRNGEIEEMKVKQLEKPM
ncbi:protein Spindly-like [Thamnophis elegans]|uniref:protein Spindly-like n=1 Tax=Thamnophis elegans TaxID=35005 RepID=UPI0013786C72|nr:protein Spindly-like [Thamnophis elegans]